MRTKGGRDGDHFRDLCARTFQCCGSQAPTEERAAAELRLRVLLSPESPGPLLPPAGEGRRSRRVDQALAAPARAHAGPSGCGPVPSLSAHTLVPSPQGISRGLGSPESPPQSSPPPCCPLECISLLPARPLGSVGTTRAISFPPCPHPPRPCRLPLAPTEVTVCSGLASRRSRRWGAFLLEKHLPLLTFITWSSCSLLPPSPVTLGVLLLCPSLPRCPQGGQGARLPPLTP